MPRRKWAAIAILAAFLLDEITEEEDCQRKRLKRKRRIWTKDWLELRRTEGFCEKLIVQLRAEEPALYRNFVRMTAQQFEHLLQLVQPHIGKMNTNMRASISASDRLVLTLRYLATGENFASLQYVFRIPQTTISRIIPEVLDAIYKVLVKDYIKLPRTATEWEAIAQGFNKLWQFPNCIGALDGKHVVMTAPPNAGTDFYNYKGTHSIVMMAIADAEYKLMYVDVGRSGRYSDGGVFNRCDFGQALTNNQLCLPPPKPLPGRNEPIPYVLVADDAFDLGPNIMKSYAQRELNMYQRVFNYRLSRGRRSIENVFGIMSARFRVLRKPIHLDACKTKKVVLACSVLHNFLMTMENPKLTPYKSFDKYDAEGNLISVADWNVEGDPIQTFYPLEASQKCSDVVKEIQEEFTSYFVQEGDVEWQYKHIDQ